MLRASGFGGVAVAQFRAFFLGASGCGGMRFPSLSKRYKVPLLMKNNTPDMSDMHSPRLLRSPHNTRT